MYLPVDIKKLKSAAIDIGQQQHKSLYVDLYIDGTGSKDLSTYVASLLDANYDDASVDVYDLSEFDKDRHPDFCVIVSAENELVLDAYYTMLSKDIPCALVSLVPFKLYEMDKSFQDNYNKQNIIHPKFADYEFDDYSGNINHSHFNSKMAKTVSVRLADWFVDHSDGLLLALGYNFSFIRSAAATHYINSTSIQNLGIACLPVLRAKDLPLMTINEAKMILSLAVIYDNEINIKVVPELVLMTISAFAMKYASSSLSSKYKHYKIFISAAFGFVGTQLLGYIAKSAFKHGSSFQKLLDKFIDANIDLLEAIK